MLMKLAFMQHNFLRFLSLLLSVCRPGWIAEAVLSISCQLNTWWLSNYRVLAQASGRLPIEANSSHLLSQIRHRKSWMYYMKTEHAKEDDIEADRMNL